MSNLPPIDDKRAELIGELRQARSGGAAAGQIVESARTLKVVVGHGEFRAAMREAWPEDSHPLQTLNTYRRRAEKQLYPEAAKDVVYRDSDARRYAELMSIWRMPTSLQEGEIQDLSREAGRSPRTLRRQMLKAARGGLKAIARNIRSDRGRSRVLPLEAEQCFRRLCIGEDTKGWPVSLMIAEVRKRFPDLDASDASFRRIADSIPLAVTMSDREWKATFLPSGRWEVPHINHTHVFDFTQADLFVWDRNPAHRPYRPCLIAVLDEFSRSCMFGLYLQGDPGRADLQAVLLHAWQPKLNEDGKPDRYWVQCGFPLHLHCDNGKVQGSGWLKDVCREIGNNLYDQDGRPVHESIRHTPVRTPWHQGHIERFYGHVHTHFELYTFPNAYCGRSPQDRPEGFKGNEGTPRDWEAYPTLDQLNYAFRVWVPNDYHQSENRTLHMSPLESWQRHAAGHVNIADPDYLRMTLMQRADNGGTRLVRHGMIQNNNCFYFHSLLQSYEQAPVSVRWDPAEFDHVFVFEREGDGDGRFICEARREQTRNPDNPKDVAEHKSQTRQKKAMRRILKEGVRIAPGLSDEEQERHAVEMRQAAENAERERLKGTIPFPGNARAAKQRADDEPITADEILALVGPQEVPASLPAEAQQKEEPLELYGIEI